MAHPKIFAVKVFADLPATFLARLEDLATGALVTQASLFAISYRVFDVSGTQPDRYLSGGTVAIATAISNHLKIDNRWKHDGVGFNFSHTLPGTTFPLGPATLLLEYSFTPVGMTTPAYGLFYNVRVLQTRTAGALAGTGEGMGTGMYQEEGALTAETTIPVGHLDFTILQGATFRLPITWKDAAQALVPLVGCHAWLQVRQPADAPTVLLELSTTNGGILVANTAPNLTLYVSDENTALLPLWGMAPYELLIEYANGERKLLLAGYATLLPSLVQGTP